MDDFDYFGMSPAQVEAARAFVRSQFALADFTINLAKAPPPEQRFEALGLRYDLVAKTACLKRCTLPDLRCFHKQRMATANCGVSKKEVAGIAGSLVVANDAFPGSLSLLHPLIVFFSK